MPNWVHNVLTVEGPAEVLQSFRKRAVGTTFYNMPGAPTKKTTVKAIRTFKLYNPPPIEEQEVFCFQKFIDYPDEILAGGYSDAAYDWEHKTYGVKWGASCPELISYTQTKLTYTFDTAWCAPVEFFNKLAVMYPKLRFALISDYIEDGDTREYNQWYDGYLQQSEETKIPQEEIDE